MCFFFFQILVNEPFFHSRGSSKGKFFFHVSPVSFFFFFFNFMNLFSSSFITLGEHIVNV